jgi:PAS domain-containing protein
MAIEQLRLHADLDYQSRLTLSVTENATSGLFLMDHRLHVTYMNSAAREIIGYGLAELRGRSLHEAVHHSRPDGTPLPLAGLPALAGSHRQPEQARPVRGLVHPAGRVVLPGAHRRSADPA